MPGYRPCIDFTAQSESIHALMSLYAQLKRDPNSRLTLTPIVVFLAFTIEGYLNSIGARQLDIWEELERLPWRTKVEILHKIAKQPPDWGRDPLQFASEVFSLRERLAHGKPERVIGPLCRTEDEAIQRLKNNPLRPAWYAKITRQWIMEAKERHRVLMIYLGELFGFHSSDHLLRSTGGVLIEDGSVTC